MLSKYQKALDELCSRCYVESEKCTCHPKYEGGNCNNTCKYKQALQELVDKETRMKPVRKGKLNSLYCPKCDIPLMFENTKYCDKCGQKLGSDTDE